MKLLPIDDDDDGGLSQNMHKTKKGSHKPAPLSAAHLTGGCSSSSASSSSGSTSSASSDHDDQDSPPISPLRSPLFSPSATSGHHHHNHQHHPWAFSSTSSQGSQPMSLSPFRDFDDEASNESSQSGSQCNSKEDKASYNTKFAKYHLDTYRQNDRMRWNFDFDHNRPLDSDHHHHHQAVPRYQWEPAPI